MKRSSFIVLAILFLAAPSISRSQNQLYFNEGDTIYGRDTIYHYQWWSDQWMADPSNRLFCVEGYPLWHGRVLQYCHTDQPLNIIGIATSLYTYIWAIPPAEYGNYPHGLSIPTDIPPLRQEYVLLYEADTSRAQLREVGRLPVDYTKAPRYMNLELRYNPEHITCCNDAREINKVLAIREFYFEKPITVYDSFYVGHTQNTDWCPDPEGTWEAWMGVTCFGIGFLATHNHCTDASCASTPTRLWYLKQDDYARWPNGHDTNWYHETGGNLIEFPIILIDSSFFDGPPQYECPQATSFRVANIDTAAGKVVFLWDTHADHQSWQISYGPSGTAPDDGTIVNCPIQVGQIMNLDTCKGYVAYVRAVCNHDSIVYSEWSDSLQIRICDTTQGGGTERIDVTAAQFVQLLPNPAYEQVQVISSYGINSIEVYDLQGRAVLQTGCGQGDTPWPAATPLREGTAGAASTAHPALTAQFSVGGWLPGIYIAIVHTPAGNFSKKLVVK